MTDLESAVYAALLGHGVPADAAVILAQETAYAAKRAKARADRSARIFSALAESRYNVRAAAERLGITPRAVYKRIKKVNRKARLVRDF